MRFQITCSAGGGTYQYEYTPKTYRFAYEKHHFLVRNVIVWITSITIKITNVSRRCHKAFNTYVCVWPR